jgi:hypothetical protein
MRSSPVAFPRAGDRVQERQGGVARRLALRAKAEVTRGGGRRHALARPGLAPCALWRVHGHAWACLGTSMPACACVVVSKGRHGLAQESTENVQDMVEQVGGER